MPIDWFTVGAQVFNFLLLVALLRIFLYRPILDMMDRREEKIASRLEEAQRRRDEADAVRRELEEERREFVGKKEELLAKAREDAGMQRKRFVEEARAKAEEAKDLWLHEVEEERESFLRNLRRRVAGETCSLARKALADLGDAKLEEQIIRLFLDRLTNDREAIGDRDAKGTVVVRSAFELPESSREEVRKILRESPGGDDGPRFEKADDLMCGIELTIGDRKIGWSVKDYLDDFEERLTEALAEQ